MRAASSGRDPEILLGRHDSEVDHHAEEDEERDHEVHQPGQHGSGGYGEPREVDLPDQVLARHEAVGRLAQALREERPGHERRVREDGVGHAVGRDAGEPPEEEAEDDHGAERLDDGP
jgi:hypothetical protein